MAAGLALICGATPALATSYLCAFTPHTDNRTIPEAVFLDLDKAKMIATVYDSRIKYVYKKPLEVPFTEVGAGRYRLSWRVDHLPFQGNKSGSVIYTMNFRESQLTATLRLVVVGYDNEDSGSGKCKPVKPKK